MIVSVVVDRKSEAYMRLMAAGFEIVQATYEPGFLRATFKCVCGKTEYLARPINLDSKIRQVF